MNHLATQKVDKVSAVPISEGRRLRVLDAFAGAGGFSLGFQLSGFDIVGAIEIDSWASQTFLHNHPSSIVLTRDIELLSDADIATIFSGHNKPDVVIGGPPCQGFSIANRSAGDPKDPRNGLFMHFVRLGRILEPEVMVMENVPNLLGARTSTGQSVFAIIVSALGSIGYHVTSKVLAAAQFGVPQLRSRLFVIATKAHLPDPWPKATHVPGVRNEDQMFETDMKWTPSLWDAISDLPAIAAGEGSEEQDYVIPPATAYQAELRAGSRKLFNHKAMNHGRRMVQRFAAMKWGDSGNDVPAEHRPRKRNSHELASKAYDQNNRRMFPHRPCHTIPASFYANFVHPFQHRNFTAREGARIQSFPDWYRFLGKPTVVSHKLLAREGRTDERFLCQYSQIGNAVPPFLARAVATHLFSNYAGFVKCSSIATI